MPQISAKAAKEIDAVDPAAGFDPLPPGVYPARLREVRVGEGKNGPYWTWEYEIPDGYEHAGSRFWNTTSLGEKSRPYLIKAFLAHGVSSGTDTDELVGTWINMQVGIQTAQAGKRQGQPVNYVVEVMPYDGEDASEGGASEDDTPF